MALLHALTMERTGSVEVPSVKDWALVRVTLRSSVTHR